MFNFGKGFGHLVSIHAPGRGATRVLSMRQERYQSFNSRTREGCDCPAVAVSLLCEVSIHAPGRGATFF